MTIRTCTWEIRSGFWTEGCNGPSGCLCRQFFLIPTALLREDLVHRRDYRLFVLPLCFDVRVRYFVSSADQQDAVEVSDPCCCCFFSVLFLFEVPRGCYRQWEEHACVDQQNSGERLIQTGILVSVAFGASRFFLSCMPCCCSEQPSG